MTGRTPEVGLVRLDQVVAHPHNLRRNLGDLRALTASVKRHGVMVPIIVEKHGGRLRLRAGHRRVTAARIAGLARVVAIIHPDALDEDEWLIASVQENYQRRDLDGDERRRAVERLRELGVSWTGLAECFGVSVTSVQHWANGPRDPEESKAGVEKGLTRSKAHQTAVRQLIDLHRDEFEQLKAAVLAEGGLA